MTGDLLQTKLYVPRLRPSLVPRPHLIEKLNQGLQQGCKLTLISAPAGFGKTTLASAWVQQIKYPVAWLSLDEGDNELTRFLSYSIAALQTIDANIAKGALSALQSPQPPPTEAILTSLINEIATLPDNPSTGSGQSFILVLDDYHVIDARPIDDALTFLLEHLPPQMHLVIATREDPNISLARMRVRGQLTELRIADLRFTYTESAEFLNQRMSLSLSDEDVTALEARTEGWIAGLQLAAISMQGQKDNTSFIQSFSGSHHFVLDYLLEEVLQQQSESIQSFLLFTSILDRLCGPLCDAVILDPSTPGQETLTHLANANLFIVPLDNERRWYRYYHLFAELLQQRLYKLVSSTQYDGVSVNKLHIRASRWYENGGYEAEAFHHAAAAGELDRALRLVEGKGLPLYVRGALVPVLKWLESLPEREFDKRPVLWVIYARALTAAGQPRSVEEKLQAAESALQDSELDAETRDMIGRIASNRATLAYTKYQPDTVIVQAQRALEYLSPDNLATRSMTTLALGVGYMQKGNRAAAIQAFEAARSGSQKIGDNFGTAIATMALGNMYEMENKLYLATETQRQALQLFGAVPINIAYESHLGLARIFYQWNDLDSAQHHGEKSVHLARQYDETIDRYIICEVFLAYLKLAQGDVSGAAALLSETNRSVQQYNYFHRIPEVAAAQVVIFLHQGKVVAAADLAKKHELPLSQARVHLAAGEPTTALAVLEPWRRQVEVRGWQDERLKVMVLQAIALQAHGEKDKAVQLLGEALALAAPGGFIRLFVDEGLPMAHLISEAAVHGIMPDYISKLLEAFETEQMKDADETPILTASDSQPLIEPLSPRDLEVLQLVAQGLSNREISERLFLALSTVKTHNRNIFGKLQVNRRTEAIVRARELGLL